MVVRVSDGGVGTNGAALNGGALRGVHQRGCVHGCQPHGPGAAPPARVPGSAATRSRRSPMLHENMTVFPRTTSFWTNAVRTIRLAPRASTSSIAPPTRTRRGTSRTRCPPCWSGRRSPGRKPISNARRPRRPSPCRGAQCGPDAAAARRGVQRRAGDRGGARPMAHGAGGRRRGAAGAARGRGAADPAVRRRSRRDANRSQSIARPPSVTGFVTMLFVMFVAAALLAGAFDPRVLEAEDLVQSGLGLLGRFPALPAGVPNGEGGGPGRRV